MDVYGISFFYWKDVLEGRVFALLLSVVFLDVEGYSLKKWKPILRNHHINSADVDCIFKKDDLVMIVHQHGGLEVVKRAEKGEQLKKSKLSRGR